MIGLELLRGVPRFPERRLHPLRRRAALRRLAQRPPPRFVLVLCHGNIYRSPYAAAVLSCALPSPLRATVRVESAGFIGPGRPCPPEAVELAATRGVDLSRHRSRLLTPQDVNAADLIVVMDADNRRALRVFFGRAGGDVLLLGDFDPLPVARRGIDDPFDRPAEILARSYARIERCVRHLARSLDPEFAPALQRPQAEVAT